LKATKLEGYYMLRGGEFENAGLAATKLKAALTKMGVSNETIKRASISMFEAEMNVIIHAVAGTLSYTVDDDEIRITVTDMGPGIKDVEEAMREGFTTAPEWAIEKGWGNGLGLPNIRNNSDSMAIDSVVGEGTTVNIVVRMD
jgi:anti-sigma regulatory factor (Ser/Thr protein kinase)